MERSKKDHSVLLPLSVPSFFKEGNQGVNQKLKVGGKHFFGNQRGENGRQFQGSLFWTGEIDVSLIPPLTTAL